MTTYTPKRVTDLAKAWVLKALRADYHKTLEPVKWDLATVAYPDLAATAGGPDQDLDNSILAPRPTLVLYLEIPGNEKDTSLYISPILAPFLLTEERVTQAVEKALSSMREARDRSVDNV